MADAAIVDDSHVEAAVRQAMEGALHRSDDPLRADSRTCRPNLGQMDRRSRVAVRVFGSGEERALVRGFEDEPGERLPFRTADTAVRRGSAEQRAWTPDGMKGTRSPRRPDGRRCGELPGGCHDRLRRVWRIEPRLGKMPSVVKTVWIRSSFMTTKLVQSENEISLSFQSRNRRQAFSAREE